MVHNNPHSGEVSWKKGMLECGLDLTGINTTGQGSAQKGPCFEDSLKCLCRLKRVLQTVLSRACSPVPQTIGPQSCTEPQLELGPHNFTSTVEKNAQAISG